MKLVPVVSVTTFLCPVSGCSRCFPTKKARAVHARRGHASAADRFMAQVDRHAPNGCWVWLGYINSWGYGRFGDGGLHLAHRWAYAHLVGPIPEGLQLDHLCRNKACVNPEHLEPVTPQVNVRRERALRTHCPQGHPYDAINTYVRQIEPGKVGRGCRECTRAAGRRYYRRKKAAAS